MIEIQLQDIVTGRTKVVGMPGIPRVGELVVMKDGKPWRVEEVAYGGVDADGDYQQVTVRISS